MTARQSDFSNPVKRQAKILLVFLLSCSLLIAVYRVSQRSISTDLDKEASQRLEYLALDLSIQLARYESLPYLIAQQSEIITALSEPTSNSLAAANNYLTRVQTTAQADVIFLLNEKGITIATSSLFVPPEEIGTDHSLRPYFIDALKEGNARHFAMGAAFDQPGYYLSQRTSYRDKAGSMAPKNGAVVMRASLGDFEASWRSSGESIFLIDEYGIVFLATQQEWKYRPIASLRQGDYEVVTASGIYGVNLSRIPVLSEISVQQLIRSGAELGGLRKGIMVRIDDTNTPDYLAHATHITAKGWTLVRLVKREKIITYSLVMTSLAGVILALTWVLFFYFRLRKKRLDELQQSREALQQLQSELESRIAERTQELQSRIAHLKRTEQVLRDTQNEMIQAGKMASLGKMAAGITHEISQPLTAIRTLSENALLLSQLERREEARSNLQKIIELCERAALIVSELKGFSRKTDARLTRIDLNDGVRRAIAILQTQLQTRQCRVELNLSPQPIYVEADLIRLEQVVINLVINGMDAIREKDFPKVVLTTRIQSGEAFLLVEDNGSGIPDTDLEQIFEPFFTTKKVGDGLGLGLSICAAIIQSFSGKIQVANSVVEGARFEVLLPLSDGHE